MVQQEKNFREKVQYTWDMGSGYIRYKHSTIIRYIIYSIPQSRFVCISLYFCHV